MKVSYILLTPNGGIIMKKQSKPKKKDYKSPKLDKFKETEATKTGCWQGKI